MYIVFPPSSVSVSLNEWSRRSLKKMFVSSVDGSGLELKEVLRQKSPEQFLASPKAYPAPTIAVNCL